MDDILFYHASDPYGFLSNFFVAPMVLDGTTWPTVEHYFQAQKFADPDKQAEIREAPTPGVAKEIAWEPDARIRADWDVARDDVMLAAIRAKFTQHPDLCAQLLATCNAGLAEHTTSDRYWGDGGDGSGQNRLGQLLMQVRSELKRRPCLRSTMWFWIGFSAPARSICSERGEWMWHHRACGARTLGAGGRHAVGSGHRRRVGQYVGKQDAAGTPPALRRNPGLFAQSPRRRCGCGATL